MACRSPKIDVASGAYSILRGALVEDLTVASEVVLALRSHRGSSAIAPWHGSRLGTIRKVTKVSRQLARIYAREALKFLVDRGAMRNLDVQAQLERNRIRLLISYVDVAGKRQTIPYTHAVTG